MLRFAQDDSPEQDQSRFGAKHREARIKHAGINSGIQVPLVVIGKMVILPSHREGAPGARKKLHAKTKRDGEVELRRFQNRHLVIEINKPQASVKAGLNFLRPKVCLKPNRTRTGTVNRSCRIDEQLPIHDITLGGLKFEHHRHQVGGVLECDWPGSKQRARILHVEKEELPVLCGSLQHI